MVTNRLLKLHFLHHHHHHHHHLGATPTRLFSLLSSSRKLQNTGTRRDTFFAHPIKTRTSFFSSSSAAEAMEFEADETHHDVMKTTEKHNALCTALEQVDADFSKESRVSLERFFRTRSASVISTGSLALDEALGIGGLPKGRMIEIFGQEASGKTTLALHVIKEAQKLGGYCAYLDVENALDPSLAESIGVNTENLLISQPDSAENLLSVVDTLTKSGSVDVIVVDSVAALVPQCEIDLAIGEKYENIQSKIMTQALRKIQYSLCHSRTIIIFINQVRSHAKPGQGFGHADVVTCGGNALQFYSAIRLRMIRKELLKSNNKFTGLRVLVKVVKNKLAPAMATAELGIQFGGGICREFGVLEKACEHGVIVKEGNDYFMDGKVFDNRLIAESYMANNHEFLDKIIKTLRVHLFETAN